MHHERTVNRQLREMDRMRGCEPSMEVPGQEKGRDGSEEIFKRKWKTVVQN